MDQMISRMLGSEIHIRDFNGIIATINNFRTGNKVANDFYPTAKVAQMTIPR